MSYWDTAAADLAGLPGGGLNIAYEATDARVREGLGEREALRFLGADGAVRSLSYRGLADASGRFAAALDRLGIRPGTVVSALSERCPELYIAALGALKAGCVFSALFASFGPEPVRVRLAKGRTRVLVTTPDLYRRRVLRLAPRPDCLEHVIVLGAAEAPALAFDALMAEAAGDRPLAATTPDTTAFLHFTSGTTGLPKGALHRHGAVVAHQATARHALDLRPGDVYWCTADPGWVTGISYGLSAPLVSGVTTVVDAGPFDPERWYRTLADHRVTVWYTAPTAIRMLMRAGTELARRFDLSALRHIASVGEPLGADAVRWAEATFRRPVHDTWWQTETGAIMIASSPGDVVPGAMGRPVPGIDAALVRRLGDGRIEVLDGPDEQGEIALAAGWPSMFQGYLDEPDRTRACFADGYYLSGDLARRDDQGRYWFVGRADDIIKSAGHMVGPFEVEQVLVGHPAVAEAGVFGVPDPVVGEAVGACVTIKPGFPADDRLRADLLAFARRALGPGLAPRSIRFRDALPHTESGKILRRILRAEAIEDSAGSLTTRRLGED